MRKLFEIYKEAIISFLLAGTLIGILLTQLCSLGAQTSALVSNRDYGTYMDSHSFQEIAALPGPEIITREERQWTAGTEVFPLQVFAAKDSNGQELFVEVKQILNVDEQDITSLYNPQSGSVIFPEPGCYYFMLQTMDSQKKIKIEKRPLVIDSRQEDT